MVLTIIGVLIIIYTLARVLSNDIISLTNRGWVLYHSPDCDYCVKQLKDIGWQTVFMEKVDCKINPDLCRKKGIRAYPTWLNNISGKKHEGIIESGNLYDTLMAL